MKIHTGKKKKESKKMKTKNKTMLMLAGLLAFGTTALLVSAQDNNDGPPGGGQGGPGGPGGLGRHRPPVPAIIAVLDANHDGVIDSNEIANASAALKSLDKNGDGKLTPDEFMGPRPQRPGGQGRGPGGNPGGDDNNLPPGPPPGDGGGNLPPFGPPPGQQ
jgi:hypothetical protein